MPKKKPPDYDAKNYYLAIPTLGYPWRRRANAKDATLALLARILQELRDALESGGDSAARLARVQAVVAAVDANQQALADAVAANTVPPTP